MRLIDRVDLLEKHKEECTGECDCCPEYLPKTSECGLIKNAPTVEAIPVSKINEAMGKIERGLQACFNMVHCESSHDLLEGQEKAFKYCLDVLQEACDENK